MEMDEYIWSKLAMKTLDQFMFRAWVAMANCIAWNLPQFLEPKDEVIRLPIRKLAQVCGITYFLEFPPGQHLFTLFKACYQINGTWIVNVSLLG